MVLKRYGLALCVSTFFEWWYDSGTPEVRMRYADKFLLQLSISITYFYDSVN